MIGSPVFHIMKNNIEEGEYIFIFDIEAKIKNESKNVGFNMSLSIQISLAFN